MSDYQIPASEILEKRLFVSEPNKLHLSEMFVKLGGLHAVHTPIVNRRLCEQIYDSVKLDIMGAARSNMCYHFEEVVEDNQKILGAIVYCKRSNSRRERLCVLGLVFFKLPGPQKLNYVRAYELACKISKVYTLVAFNVTFFSSVINILSFLFLNNHFFI